LKKLVLISFAGLLLLFSGCQKELRNEACEDGIGSPVSFCGQADQYENLIGKRNLDFIRVNCLVGPDGASVDNAADGTYYCSGTYKLSSLESAVISLGWEGEATVTDVEMTTVDKGEGFFYVKVTKLSGGQGNLCLKLGNAAMTVLINAGCDEVKMPTGLAARFDESRKLVAVSWEDNSWNEISFELERSTNEKMGFKLIVTLPADSSSYIDSDVLVGKEYFYRVRVNAHGGPSEFSLPAEVSTFKETLMDFDGNVYKACKIGDQIWMASNLRTTHYADGTQIPDGTGRGMLVDRDTLSYWFVYNDDAANKECYGLLYTWNAMMKDACPTNNTPSGVQGACPNGWHIPSNAEWDILAATLGGMSVAGGKLKEEGIGHWTPVNNGACDEIGFRALPGGTRFNDGRFGLKGSSALFWTAGAQWSFNIDYFCAEAKRTSASARTAGLSVRCVKNQ
jgi:uncharacterized protein (TIGR02145 family)